MLRFTRQTRTVATAGAAISAIATGDKFKGDTAAILSILCLRLSVLENCTVDLVWLDLPVLVLLLLVIVGAVVQR